MLHQLLRYVEYSQRPPSGCNFAFTLHLAFLTGATLTGLTGESLEDASGRETLASSRPGVEPKGGSQEAENSKWSLCASRTPVWGLVIARSTVCRTSSMAGWHILSGSPVRRPKSQSSHPLLHCIIDEVPLNLNPPTTMNPGAQSNDSAEDTTSCCTKLHINVNNICM